SPPWILCSWLPPGPEPASSATRLSSALTWNSFDALQSVPSEARTQRSSDTDPAWYVICNSCAAVTSIAWPALCGTPLTAQCPLAAATLASQNQYLAMVSLPASLTENSND